MGHTYNRGIRHHNVRYTYNRGIRHHNVRYKYECYPVMGLHYYLPLDGTYTTIYPLMGLTICAICFFCFSFFFCASNKIYD